jgi:ankyrin repeat protein
VTKKYTSLVSENSLDRSAAKSFIPLTPMSQSKRPPKNAKKRHQVLSTDSSSEYQKPITPWLPTEIQIRIISQLDYKSLDVVGQVCRAWRFISSDQNMWRKQMQQAFGIPSDTLSAELSSASWRRVVKETHQIYKPLCDAVKLDKSLENGHFVLATRLAVSNPSLLTDDIFYTACKYGHLQVAVLAANGGAKVNRVKSSDEGTPLYIAAQEGHLPLVQMLVSIGANIEVIFRDGYTPLYIAAQNNRANVMKLLLSSGANVNVACTRGGSTPLYIASQRGNLEATKTLLEAGASGELLFKGYSCLYVAARNGHDFILAFLLAHFHDMIEVRGGDGSSVIYVASQNGHAKCVKLLVDAYANTESTFSNGYRPLYIAAQHGHSDVVEVLCQAGALLDAYNRNSVALYVACQNGHLDCVKSLAKHGASVNIATTTISQCTPLRIAAQKNHLAICEVLLKHGAIVDLVFDVMITPLYAACSNGHLDVAEMLLRCGASPNGIINSDKVPLHNAMQQDYRPIIKLLIEMGADTEGIEQVDCNASTLEYTRSFLPSARKVENRDVSSCKYNVLKC